MLLSHLFLIVIINIIIIIIITRIPRTLSRVLPSLARQIACHSVNRLSCQCQACLTSSDVTVYVTMATIYPLSALINFPLHSTPLLGDLRRNIAITFGVEIERCGYPTVKEVLCLAVSIQYRRVTNRHTDTVRAMIHIAR